MSHNICFTTYMDISAGGACFGRVGDISRDGGSLWKYPPRHLSMSAGLLWLLVDASVLGGFETCTSLVVFLSVNCVFLEFCTGLPLLVDLTLREICRLLCIFHVFWLVLLCLFFPICKFDFLQIWCCSMLFFLCKKLA